MENLNHTEHKTKHKHHPLVYLEEAAKTSLIQRGVLNPNDSRFELTTVNGKPDITIKGHEQLIHFQFIKNNRVMELRSNYDNFNYIFGKILNNFQIDAKAPKFSSKNLNSFERNKDFWDHNHFLINKLNENFKSNKNIFQFTQNLFKLPELSSFKTIHLFIHEKGSINSHHVQLTNTGMDQTVQNVSEFSTLFQAIKKSKNRSFGQSSLKASAFQIIGTCLAHEFSLSKHNLILIIGKNDFLPQSEEDINLFKRLSIFLKYYYDLLLTINFNNKESSLIFKSISELPYKSNLRDFFKDTENSKLESIPKEILIGGFQKVLTSLTQENFDLADVHHQERMALLGELLNTLRHELSNPLFGLQLSSELLEMEELEEDQNAFIKEIGIAIKRSQSIITNFSDLYNEKPQLEDVDLVKVLNEVITLTKSESRNIKKEVTNNCNKELRLKTKQTWLVQILFNLIINSAQALNEAETPVPQIDITLEHLNKEIQITIADNGPGIKDPEKAFDPFFTTKVQGNGLGLAISQSLAEKLNGSLIYEGSSSGAIFKIRLPI